MAFRARAQGRQKRQVSAAPSSDGVGVDPVMAGQESINVSHVHTANVAVDGGHPNRGHRRSP